MSTQLGPWRTVIAARGPTPADLPLLLLTPLWLWWAIDEGGYAATTWIPGLVYAAALTTILLVAGERPIRPCGARLVAVGALGALAVLSCVSVSWAGDQGLAWRESTRTMLFCASFVVPVLWPPTDAGLVTSLVLAALASCVALVAGVVEAFGGGPALADGRLTAPAGYANAVAAILAVGAAALAPLALDPTRRPVARGAMLGVATALVAGSLLAQSRGGLAALVATAIVLVLASPRRGTAAVAVALMAVATLVASGTILDVLPAATEGEADGALRSALLAIAGAGAASGAAWTLAVRAGPEVAVRRLRLAGAPRAWRRAGPVLAALVVAAIVVATDPVQWVGDRADSFVTPNYDRLEQQDSRFGGDLGSNRADYWEASLETLGDEPVLGTGAGGFAEAYVLRRETHLTPLFAHGIWFQQAADLGVPGLLLLMAFAGAGVAALRVSWHASDTRRRLLLTAGALPLLYAGIHGSVDWVAVFPGLMVPVLALAGAAIGAGGRDPAVTERLSRRASALVVVPLLAVTAAALPLYLSWRFLERAAGAPPPAALVDLRRAGDLNPLSPAPALNRGLLLLAQGRDQDARAAFAEAIERNPGAWFPHLMHGVLRAGQDRRGALRDLDAAVRLNPRDDDVRRIRDTVRAGQSPAPVSVARIFVEEGARS